MDCTRRSTTVGSGGATRGYAPASLAVSNARPRSNMISAGTNAATAPLVAVMRYHVWKTQGPAAHGNPIRPLPKDVPLSHRPRGNRHLSARRPNPENRVQPRWQLLQGAFEKLCSNETSNPNSIFLRQRSSGDHGSCVRLRSERRDHFGTSTLGTFIWRISERSGSLMLDKHLV